MHNPHQIADEVVTLSAEYSLLSEELSSILGVKAVRWAEFRSEEGCSSDKQADRKWERTPDGIREMQLKLILKASEKRQSALKAKLRLLETDARQQI